MADIAVEQGWPTPTTREISQGKRREVTMPTAEAAFRESLHAGVKEMARELQQDLGQRLVAYVTESSSKTVGRWASGANEPHDQAEGRLRALYRTMLILREEPPETIRAWLTSPNPDLGDDVPAEVLREGQATRVFRAAQAFMQP
jgi:hypothetical protein